MTLRAVCYPRVSGARQRDAHTIESQLRMLPEFIARMGWELAAPASTYMDDGFTAKAGHLEARLGLQRLLRDAAAGAFDVVVVVDLDRLTRAEDMLERATIIGAFQRAGVKVASAISGQVLDLDTSHGDLLASLGGFFAAEWSRKHRARILEGKATAIARGRKPAGPTPYGLTYERATGAWGVDAERAPVVREIYDRVLRGEPYRQIAAALELAGAPRTRDGAWTHARVREIALAPTYRGEWLVHKARGLAIPVPPIVTPELWHAAQAAQRARRPANWTRGLHVNLCQGVSVCGVCGEPMGVTGGGKNPIRYYVCLDKKREGAGVDRCSNRMRQIPPTDELVWGLVRNLVLDDELLEQAAAPRAPGPGEAADFAREAKAYERQLAKLERAEAEILALFRRGKISAGAFERELAAAARDRELLERNRDLARDQLGRAARAQAQQDALAATLAELRARVDQTTPEERRALIRQLVRPGDGAITMRPREVEIVGRVPLPMPAGERIFPAAEVVSTCDRGENGVVGVRFRVVA